MKKQRESFKSQWGFILACIGSSVGMGNIWMFSTRVSSYGGGSFLIPYFIFVALVGFTGVIGEMSFGRATRSGPVDAFGIACERKGKRKVRGSVGDDPGTWGNGDGNRLYGCDGMDPEVCSGNVYRKDTCTEGCGGI